MSARLTLDAVSKRFAPGAPPALTGVDLDISPGSCTAILGPSGSGKSTILRIMAGLDDATSGRVLVDGVAVDGVPPERRGMGMVFQRPLLFPHLSVLDNVAFADRVAGMARSRARERAQRYLDMVQLHGYGPRSVDALSGGQEQRVAIARALAAEPAVLLLDEPFSALDPALRADMHALVAEVRATLSPTTVLVTHDRDEASVVADRIAVLHEGVVQQHDTVDRVYHRPASLRVSRLMGGENEVGGEVRGGVHLSPLGRVRLEGPAGDGAAVLVIRQEAVGVRPAGSPGRREGALDTPGRVVDVRLRGPRRSVTVAVGAARLVAEVPPGQGVEVGTEVEVTLPPGAVSAVPPA